MNVNTPKYSVKIAENEHELHAVQRLRYQVFVTELGATGAKTDDNDRELDQFDRVCDHILLIENATNKVVGCYRVLPRDAALNASGFYGSSEFNLDVFTNHPRTSVELGRSCIALDHRGGVALQMLWAGLADYISAHKIDLLFGLASFKGTDPAPYAQAFSHLHHAYAAPLDLRARARSSGAIAMDMVPPDQVDRVTAMRQMPALVKSYIRLGGRVGAGAFVDFDFQCIDVCVVMDTAQISAKHQRLYNKGVL